ncbi:MAG: hypothetical protein NTZ27_09980 [Ignavibacteriales bacterium]|nr:hypothetical protein [Ignavibacteriales bacterium]
MRNGAAKIFLILILMGALNNFFCQTAKSNWNAFKFLIGEWTGEGTGAPGEGSGQITFYFALQDQILVRKNHTEYPATANKSAFTHDNVLIHYHENNLVRAIYFDNEGHVIHYTTNFSSDLSALVLTSDVIPSAPRFRFTYTKLDNERLKVSFEIASPGKPEEFSKYLDGVVKKKI